MTVGDFPTPPSTFDDPRRNVILDAAIGIRKQTTHWKACCTVIGESNVEKFETFADASAEKRAQLLSDDGVFYIQVLLRILLIVSKLDTLKTAITMLDDITQQNDAVIELLAEAIQDLDVDSPSECFIRLLSRHDEPDTYLTHQSARILTRLVLAGYEISTQQAATYLDWACGQLTASDGPARLLTLTSLGRVLRRDTFREALLKHSKMIEVLKVAMTSSTSLQQQYQVLLCLWVLTFNPDIVVSLNNRLHVLIAPACDVLVDASKEKLVRMAVGFLRNCIAKSEPKMRHEYASLMVSHKVHPRVKAIVQQQLFTDEELLADAEEVEEELRITLDNLSSFDEYVAELKSGALVWSPVHRSERFWRESVNQLNEHHHELLKNLVSYLDSDDAQSVAVACHDCGEYVRHYPYGKKALEELGAKNKIMLHMEHSNATVRFESLIAVQKMMTDQWEFLGMQTKKAAEEPGY